MHEYKDEWGPSTYVKETKVKVPADPSKRLIADAELRKKLNSKTRKRNTHLVQKKKRK